MGHFWCWFLGHKWHEASVFMQRDTSFGFSFFCERCGKAAGVVKIVPPRPA